MESNAVVSALTLVPPGGPWTVADYMALPESPTKVELQDGCFVVSPSPTSAHQYCLIRLTHVLMNQLSSDLVPVTELDTVLTATSVRRPDVLIVRGRHFASGTPYPGAEDVVLAVEVVSPSSTGTDRLLKPAEYAAAGIEGFWRIELDPHVQLSAYILRAGTYVELGTWGPGDIAHVTEPVDVRIPIDDLTWPGHRPQR